MTDDSAAERAALQATWPSSTCLLCHFHVAQAEWRWLMSAKNKVNPAERRPLMSAFQKIMYASTAEDLESAKAHLQTLSHEAFVTRVQDFLRREEEWVLFFRKWLPTSGHNTNNFSEACIRILKDIILGRTKAFNAVALVDFVAIVWEKYFEARILEHAHNRVAAGRLLYDRLLKKMPQGAADKIVSLEHNVYSVPSAEQTGETYRVYADIGTCTCGAGKQGAFCKHQALVHKTVGGIFPNAPALTAEDRHQLGNLALGDSFPPVAFFKNFRVNEALTSQQEETHHADSTPVPQQHPADPCFTEPSEPSTSYQSGTADKCITGDIHALWKELERCHMLVKGNSTYNKYLQKAMHSLKKIQTASQCVGMMMSLGTTLSHITRCDGHINVQPTSISRRREGLTRGSKRVAAGRPSNQPSHKKAKKRTHRLSLSVKDNVSHAKSHGQGH
ncbi:uncharacterized protein LOC135379136 [Ornithodoros turicata]|uniref:uncharacterized protein LOC135379136 n=1 Tax=Ornithodoros turicata TaxID=34597 RepID=UPI003138DF1C